VLFPSEVEIRHWSFKQRVDLLPQGRLVRILFPLEYKELTESVYIRPKTMVPTGFVVFICTAQCLSDPGHP